MVSVEEVPEEEKMEQQQQASTTNNKEQQQQQQQEQELSPWQERLLDAEEIEQVVASMKRPTARMQLEALAKRIRKDSDALKRVEQSQQRMNSATATATATESADHEEKKQQPDDSSAPAPAPATAPPPPAIKNPTPPPALPSSAKYVSIDRFAFDAGGYNAPFVTLYVDLPRVGSIPRDNIKCHFTKDSFDLIVQDLEGKSYRLCKDSLEKDIDVEKSKIIVKADKIVIKLAKVKQGDYGGFDYWSKLTDTKKNKSSSTSKKDDPQSSIMDLMKQMYDEGDDNMRKVIGETMLKQQRGELGKNDDDMMKGMDDM